MREEVPVLGPITCEGGCPSGVFPEQLVCEPGPYRALTSCGNSLAGLQGCMFPGRTQQFMEKVEN